MGKKKNITAFSDQADFDAFLSAILAEPKPDLEQGYLLVKRAYNSLVEEKKDLEKNRNRRSRQVTELLKKTSDSPENEATKLEKNGQREPSKAIPELDEKSFEASMAEMVRTQELEISLHVLGHQLSTAEHRYVHSFLPAIRLLKGEADTGTPEILSAATYAYDISPRDIERTDLVRVIAEASAPSEVLLVNPPIDTAIRFADYNTDRLVSYCSEDESFAEITQLIGVNNLEFKGKGASQLSDDDTGPYDCVVIFLEDIKGEKASANESYANFEKRSTADGAAADSVIEDFSKYFDLHHLAGCVVKGGRLIALATSDLTLGVGSTASILGALERHGLGVTQIISKDDSDILLFVIEHRDSAASIHLSKSKLHELAISELWDDPVTHEERRRMELWNVLQRKPGRIAGGAVLCAGQRPVSPETHRIMSDASEAAKDMGYHAHNIAEVFGIFELKPAVDTSYLKNFDQNNPNCYDDPDLEEIACKIHGAAERVDPRSWYFSKDGSLSSGLEFLRVGDAGGDWQSNFDQSALIRVRPGSDFVPEFFQFWMDTAPGKLLRHLISEGKAGSNDALNARRQRAITLGKCVFIPSTDVQQLLIDTISNLERISEDTELRRRGLTEDIGNLETLHRQVKGLSLEESEASWVASLPYFLSVIMQSYRRASSARDKYKLLETFFEQLTQFYAIILLSCLEKTPDKEETHRELGRHLRNHHHSLSEPSFGLWRAVHDFLRGVYQRTGNVSKVIFSDDKHVSSDWILSAELAAISKSVNSLRNEEGEAHGGLGSEDFYEGLLVQMQGYLTTYRDLSGSIFREVIFYQLDQSANMGDVSECTFRILVGHSERFETEKTTTDHEPRELISNALYLSGDELNTLIPIVPLLRMDRESAVSVAAFYNGRKGDKYKFKSFQELDSPNRALEDLNFERRLQKYLSNFEV